MMGADGVIRRLLVVLTTSWVVVVKGQQQYENNAQLNCYGTNASTTLGYSCNATGSLQSCSSYLIFRSSSPYYQSPVQISFLLNSSASDVSDANSVTDVVLISDGDLILVPIPCSCSSGYYQHNASYTLKFSSETYFTVANNTYQGLTTCQALIGQNAFDSKSVKVGGTMQIPLRCACPSPSQSASGIKYLLSYLITWGDNPYAIATRFGISLQSLLDANQLTKSSPIFPFTTLLVPLETEPTKAQLAGSSPSPPPASPPPPPPAPTGGKSSNNEWVYVGVERAGVVVGLAAIIILFLF